MKQFFSRVMAFVLVAVIALSGLTACSPAGNLSGNYRDDALTLVTSLREAIELPENTPEKAAAQSAARENINEFIARYRRDSAVSTLPSFTTMSTALNGLASHYSSYGNRPLSSKLKDRLNQEFTQVEMALKRGA